MLFVPTDRKDEILKETRTKYLDIGANVGRGCKNSTSFLIEFKIYITNLRKKKSDRSEKNGI